MPYVYCAELFCDECGEKICELITADGRAPKEPNNQHTYDSDDFPKHTENGSTDAPNHCPDCGRYLADPLTNVGIDYVIGYLRRAIETGDATECEQEWAADLAANYFLTNENDHVLNAFLSKFPPKFPNKKGPTCFA